MSPLSVKLDLHYNGEVLSTSDDRKLIGQIPFKDRTVSNSVHDIQKVFQAALLSYDNTAVFLINLLQLKQLYDIKIWHHIAIQ